MSSCLHHLKPNLTNPPNSTASHFSLSICRLLGKISSEHSGALQWYLDYQREREISFSIGVDFSSAGSCRLKREIPPVKTRLANNPRIRRTKTASIIVIISMWGERDDEDQRPPSIRQAFIRNDICHWLTEGEIRQKFQGRTATVVRPKLPASSWIFEGARHWITPISDRRKRNPLILGGQVRQYDSSKGINKITSVRSSSKGQRCRRR